VLVAALLIGVSMSATTGAERGDRVELVTLGQALETALNLIGTFVLAVSGALLGVRKRFDLVGIAVLAQITAVGGGILRDVLIGAIPPVAFTDVAYFLLPLLATTLVFFAHARLDRLYRAMLIFDAAGLGLFAVAGAAKASAAGLGPLAAIALGALSAVGGGILRDVLANDLPTVFRSDSELYAVPAVLGATIVVVAQRQGLYGPSVATGAALFVFALRLLALRAPACPMMGREAGARLAAIGPG
jgi:uncharacterized membrane protein YeiH